MINKLLRILGFVFILAVLPLVFAYKLANKAIFNHQVKTRPVKKILEKVSMFLMPQVAAMQEIEGNRFGLITYESVLYVKFVAEDIGGRRLTDDERDWVLLMLLGMDYLPRIVHLADKLIEIADDEGFAPMARNLKQIAHQDVQSGLFFCSNFLVSNAKALGIWQKSVREASL